MNNMTRHIVLSQKSLFCFMLAGIALLAAGCGTFGRSPKPTAKLEDVVATESGSKQEIKEMNDKLFASVGSAPDLKDYVLGEGDLVQVSVFESQDLKTETRVGARGFMTLGLLGPVEVKGLTAREAEQKIEDLYRQKYIQNPHVSVFVKEHVSGKVTLMGAVKKPGTFDYFARQHLLDVLALAEGLSDKAGRTVQVRRSSANDSAHPSTFLVDLDDLIKRGQSELNLEIKGGDVIYVPEAGMIYVDGAVRKAGTYPITQTMTVQQAIVTAGGFSKIADEGNIKLVRTGSDGKREVTQFSIKEVEQGSATGRALEVKDRDVIFVETDTLRTMMYGLRLNLGGLIGVGYEPPSTSQ